MIEGNFKVRSLESINTINQDIDVGIVRVSGWRLKELGSRNSLVRVSTIKNGKKPKCLFRIARAKTGKHALKKNEIALQYDDRLLLGIDRADEFRMLSIKPVGQWWALIPFLFCHTSPLVRKEVAFAVVLLIVGFFLGLFIPSPFG